MDFTHLLNDTITISLRQGEDAHGQPAYGPQQKVQARVETAYAFQIGVRNSQYKFSHAICLAQPLNPMDRVWLGSDDTTSTDAARLVERSESAYTADMVTDLYMAYL